MDERQKMCVGCGLIKPFSEYDIDHKDATDRTARCKVCRGTADPIKAVRKPSKSKSRREYEGEAVEPSPVALGEDVDASAVAVGAGNNDVEPEADSLIADAVGVSAIEE